MIAAYALSRINFRGWQAYLNWILSQRFMPPIAIIVPIVFMFHYAGLRDTITGLIFIHTLINLPVAVLLMTLLRRLRCHRSWSKNDAEVSR